MIYVGPALARELVDDLEAGIVDPERAARAGSPEGSGDDQAVAVPAFSEPPD